MRPVVRSSFVEVLGLRIYVREAGAGEPVLLLHGLGVSGRYFVPLASVLAARRQVIVPDLPGWGRSERPSRPLGLGGAADVLGELLRRRGRGAVSIVANSFGCQVALMLAQRRPELVGPLTLVGPTVDPRYRSWSVHAARLGPVAKAAHAAHFSHPLVVARLVESCLEEGPDRLGELDG